MSQVPAIGSNGPITPFGRVSIPRTDGSTAPCRWSTTTIRRGPCRSWPSSCCRTFTRRAWSGTGRRR
ncbi:MAG: hypothetical protein AMS20_06000 [Gemmatimonas sp. SG8_28]|nr:MAG: hypothetical protein AMS20_06000 [Gemmatimonas sp. SG8_28]